ncbi:hypothetical protein Ddye_029599 [Dipteronia dyeriana]|uniref:Uncharacterized protein n=1 Tax=Dipteronia dyeriana TaxID=168575 RepID=A0AAD9TEV6_9ROSI|nr:hypothetical protein Ddye_029599 [Dipteronia dyeriana]
MDRVADQTRPVNQYVAPPMVRLETRQAVLVQGIEGDARLQDTWLHPGGVLPDGEGSQGRAQQAVRFRAELEDGNDVLHRRLREGERGLDQLYRTVHRAALQVRHRLRDRRL